jgi:hypothetical protein
LKGGGILVSEKAKAVVQKMTKDEGSIDVGLGTG